MKRLLRLAIAWSCSSVLFCGVSLSADSPLEELRNALETPLPLVTADLELIVWDAFPGDSDEGLLAHEFEALLLNTSFESSEDFRAFANSINSSFEGAPSVVRSVEVVFEGDDRSIERAGSKYETLIYDGERKSLRQQGDHILVEPEEGAFERVLSRKHFVTLPSPFPQSVARADTKVLAAELVGQSQSRITLGLNEGHRLVEYDFTIDTSKKMVRTALVRVKDDLYGLSRSFGWVDFEDGILPRSRVDVKFQAGRVTKIFGWYLVESKLNKPISADKFALDANSEAVTIPRAGDPDEVHWETPERSPNIAFVISSCLFGILFVVLFAFRRAEKR